MKLKFIYTVLFLFLSSALAWAKLPAFNGKVTDASTKKPLAGASVSIPDLRLSALTNQNGEYSFKNVPDKGTFLVQVSYIGYRSITKSINLSESPDFELEPSVIEAHEVVITGSAFSSSSKQNSSSVSTVSKLDLITKPSTNLIDAISKVPGVSQITTGNGISKPVIRGLSYSRVVTLSNGVKQEGQQWGDEHGIEVDQFSADRIEVLRGAASLIYGSDALGGVINILDPLPSPEGELKGELVSNYSTNNGLTANSLMLAGNSNGFIFRARGTYKNAYSFKTPTGYFPNSGLTEQNFNGEIGLNKSWGYTHLDVSSFKNYLGFYEPAINESGSFVDDDSNTFTNDQFKDRKITYPKQQINHYKIALNSNFLFNKGSLKSTFGFQHSLRREFDEPDNPELFLNLKTYSYDLKYYFQVKNGWEPAIGASGQFQNSDNIEGLEKLIPSYKSRDFGGFAYIKKSWDKTTVNAGARFDYRKITGDGLIEDGETKFTDFSNNFSNVTGAIGVTHEFDDNFSFKSNAGSAFRAPNIAELSSNGVHEGAYRYEVGNPDLKPEKSYQLDGSFSYDNNYVSVSLGGFLNYINDFIYYRNLDNETIVADDQLFPLFRYVQDNAFFRGGEASLTLHPVSYFHFENTFSYTMATNRTIDKPVPFIPAASLHNELRFEPQFTKSKLTKSYISVGLQSAFKQTRIDDFETPTSGYSLLEAGVGTTIMLGKSQPLTIYVSGRNLLDKKYYDHLSRFKPGRLDETNPTLGVYNTGRNISFGVYIPFIVSKNI